MKYFFIVYLIFNCCSSVYLSKRTIIMTLGALGYSRDGNHRLVINKLSFNWTRYSQENPDVPRVFGNSLDGCWAHYWRHGQFEGRIAYIAPGCIPQGIVNINNLVVTAENIDWRVYFSDNSDVRNSPHYGPRGREGAWDHFLNYGHVESRFAAPYNPENDVKTTVLNNNGVLVSQDTLDVNDLHTRLGFSANRRDCWRQFLDRGLSSPTRTSVSFDGKVDRSIINSIDCSSLPTSTPSAPPPAPSPVPSSAHVSVTLRPSIGGMPISGMPIGVVLSARPSSPPYHPSAVRTAYGPGIVLRPAGHAFLPASRW